MTNLRSRAALLSADEAALTSFVCDPHHYFDVAHSPSLTWLANQIDGAVASVGAVLFRRSGENRSAPRRSLDFTVERCDALIVIPPFATLDQPSLGSHLLQAAARSRGFDVRVLYANILLAERMGVEAYETICRSVGRRLVGERFFAREAYGTNAVPESREGRDPIWRVLHDVQSWTGEWIESVAERIASARIPIIGCSSMFEQTTGSIALLRAIKRRAPETIAIMGGANCAGPMAAGVATLSSAIDHVFSGDSDATFPRFLEQVRIGQRPQERVIRSEPVRVLDEIPAADFAEYFDQLERIEGNGISASDVWLPYEASRGCWWGEKHHCTFCGLNGEEMVFREKSADRVIDDLRTLTSRHPGARICLVDNIMPHRYFQTLLPRLPREVPGLAIFAEQKSNLSLEKTRQLRDAGVVAIQPGIEALSTPLLRHMRKGVSGPQNVALLRYARAVALPMYWNLLYGFPGDSLEWYAETSTVAPSLTHLHPPTALVDVNIERFSPYCEKAEEFGVRNLRPVPSYREVLPEAADYRAVAYQFEGDYDSPSLNGSPVMDDLRKSVDHWRSEWERGAPLLGVARLTDDEYLLADTRGEQRFEVVDREHADAVLVARRESSASDWAIANRAAVRIDSGVVPLATAEADLLADFETR